MNSRNPSNSGDSAAHRFLIIGAGPSGLAAARALSRADIPFEIAERHRDVGGIWDMENEGTPMYESAHFISSKTLSAFDDFPMPAQYPDYPSRSQILDYIRAFAERFDLRRHARFGMGVESVSPADGGWDVRFATGERGRYRGVIAAVGHNWDPVTPEYPGTFDGVAYHSRQYRDPAQLDGRRVLIVGGGNSACDIAADAAVRARRTLISFRRGYYFLPKYLFGKPIDVFFRSGPELPIWLAQPLLSALLRLVVGDLRRYGLPKPDHRVLETHPIVNSQLMHYLAHGDVAVKPNVAVLAGGRVRFVDGSEEDVDTIIYATGYRPTIPCLRPILGAGDVTGRDLYLNIAPRGHRHLYVVGHFEADGGAYPLVSKQAELIAALIRAERDHPDAFDRFEQRKSEGRWPDLTGGVRHVSTVRHSFYAQAESYDRILRQTTGRLRARAPSS